MQHRTVEPVGADPRVELVAQSDERWLRFLSDAHPSLFHTPRWCSLISTEYGFPGRVALALSGSTVVAGLPYAEVNDFRGRRRVAYAFSDVCGPLGLASAWPAIEAALCSEGIPWQIRSLLAPSAAADSIDSPGVHQTMELPATVPQALAMTHEKQRVNARRLERAGGTCRKISDRTFLEPFYCLFATLRKRKFRLLPQSKEFFERLAAAYFPEHGFALFAELNGNVLAAMIFLAEGDTLYYKYGASNADAGDLRPSNFLFQKAIEEAVVRGYRRLDLGISIDEGLRRFKRHLGAASAPYYVGRYAERPKTEEVAELERTLSALTRVLTEPEVPLAAAADAGAALYRFFV
ncbi:MAG: GNAT family N-acetyltransferase [Candidatus Eremiobacter antarcticus]